MNPGRFSYLCMAIVASLVFLNGCVVPVAPPPTFPSATSLPATTTPMRPSGRRGQGLAWNLQSKCGHNIWRGCPRPGSGNIVNASDRLHCAREVRLSLWGARP